MENNKTNNLIIQLSQLKWVYCTKIINPDTLYKTSFEPHTILLRGKTVINLIENVTEDVNGHYNIITIINNTLKLVCNFSAIEHFRYILLFTVLHFVIVPTITNCFIHVHYLYLVSLFRLSNHIIFFNRAIQNMYYILY